MDERTRKMASEELARRALDLFDAVVDLTPEGRAAQLDERCGDDAALRGEVEALLAASLRTEDLELPVVMHEAAGGRAGERIGAYRLLEPIGEGGMGTVWRAERADQAYDRQVALKLLAARVLDPEMVRRFAVERRLLARLDHPGIVRILDGGTTAAGLPYLVMDLVEGEQIDDYCATHDLPLADRLELFVEICRAVEHAHRNLVVHRDLKPSNILVGADGSPHLLDFGIAKALSQDGAAEPGLTATLAGSRFLTPEYASPEQVRGESMTTASDVYSLGVLLYRLAAGVSPYRFPDRRPTTVERVVCEEPVTRPSAMAARHGNEVARPVRRDLDAVVLRAMEKFPARRYGSVERLRDDVERLRAGHPVSARMAPPVERVTRFVRRHRIGVASAAVVTLAILAGSAGTFWQADRARRARAHAEAEAAKATQVSEFLRGMLAAANPVTGGRSLPVADLLDQASAGLAKRFADEPLVEIALRRTLAESYWALSLHDEARRETRRGIALARAAGAAGRTELGALQRILGGIDLERGAYARSAHALAAARATLAGAPGHAAAVERALVDDQLGMLLNRTGKQSLAEPHLRRAVAELERLGVSDIRYGTALNNLAITVGNAGRQREAEGLLRRAIVALTACCGADNPRTLEVLTNLAGAIDAQGRHAEAEPIYRDAVRRVRAVYGPDHLHVILDEASFSTNLELQGKFGEADRVASHAVAAARRSLGEQHPITAYAEVMDAEALIGLGRARQAEPLARQALATREKLLPPGHWLIATARGTLGWALAHEGRLDEGRALLERAYRDLLADRGPDHEQTRHLAERLAELKKLRR